MKWLIWRPVIAGYAGLMEVKTQWSIDDLMDCHDIMDIKDDAEAEALSKAKR